jgi:hypothetical protein
MKDWWLGFLPPPFNSGSLSYFSWLSLTWIERWNEDDADYSGVCMFVCDSNSKWIDFTFRQEKMDADLLSNLFSSSLSIAFHVCYHNLWSVIWGNQLMKERKEEVGDEKGNATRIWRHACTWCLSLSHFLILTWSSLVPECFTWTTASSAVPIVMFESVRGSRGISHVTQL